MANGDTAALAARGDPSGPPHSPQWYVIRIHPQADYAAARELGRDGFQVFSPRVTRVRGRGESSEGPLFPGYLFLQCEPQSVGRITFRPGHRVAGWLNFSGVVPPVPDEVISELRQRVERINRDGGLWRRFKPGETVRLTSGGMESLAEVVDETGTPQGRVTVLLSFMGRLVQARVPRESLHPMEVHAEVHAGETRRLPRRTRGRGRWIRGFAPLRDEADPGSAHSNDTGHLSS